jgi:hypothetical protein
VHRESDIDGTAPRGKKLGSIFTISEILENVSLFLRVDITYKKQPRNLSLVDWCKQHMKISLAEKVKSCRFE